jgi:hypothetical protein
VTTAFRLIDEITRVDDDAASAVWTPTGRELGGDGGHVVPALVLEAMAQCAGMLLHETLGGRWLLAGIDDAEVAPITAGEPIVVSAVLTDRPGRHARLCARAQRDGRMAGAARLLMTPLR